MNKAMLGTMTSAEQRLVAETASSALAELDEDELLELHARVRRARNKYVSNYRRAASSGVRGRGGRGHSFPANQRDRDKAEVFESALARVSRKVATRAGEAAALLRGERIAAARGDGSGPEPTPSTATGSASAGRTRSAKKTTGGIKKDASSRAAGARRQAKRDAR